ncbi:hypothetical protein [Mycobacterium uberis]|nr:hypothetical protein [Mycobacterium uberis]
MVDGLAKTQARVYQATTGDLFTTIQMDVTNEEFVIDGGTHA